MGPSSPNRHRAELDSVSSVVAMGGFTTKKEHLRRKCLDVSDRNKDCAIPIGGGVLRRPKGPGVRIERRNRALGNLFLGSCSQSSQIIDNQSPINYDRDSATTNLTTCAVRKSEQDGPKLE